MKRIGDALGARSYDVVIEEGAIDRARDHLEGFARGNRLIVVSDETVWAAQGRRLSAALSPIQVLPIVLPPGERTKSFAVLAELIDRLLGHGVERSDHIVAFGGGVIGDLTGFAAAIVNRGCNYVQIPTTLLAQVDSSVGGKTAINVPAGKNLVGAFHQPSAVLIDPLCLKTLDPREIRAGYAEVVKYALIEDAAFFDWLEAHGETGLGGNLAAFEHMIATSVAGKAAIVAADERETSGKRALLNLGHTFGHALEAETGYSDRLLHGEAVAVGLVIAFRFSAERGLCAPSDGERVAAHLRRVGLPASLEDVGISASGARLVEHMALDKKKEAGRIAFILARGIGQAFVDKNVELAEVAAFLDRQL